MKDNEERQRKNKELQDAQIALQEALANKTDETKT